MADVRSVAVGFWVGTGSRDEPESVPGHPTSSSTCCSRGRQAAQRPRSPKSLDEVGGDCNAFTTKEYTAFYIRLLAEHLPLGLDILSEIMWDPALRPDDVDAERRVILDEILMHADEPADLVAERWPARCSPATRSGRDTLGTAASVRRHRGRTTSGRSSSSTTGPGNMVVSVAGDCDHEAWPRRIEQRFTGATGRRPPRRAAPRRPGRSPWWCCAGRPSRPIWSSGCARSPASTRSAGRWPS